MSEPRVVVEADNVSKKFRLVHERNHSLKATIMRGRRVVSEDFWALRGVSLQIREGETFGLIGENGSGKSTMLKCLTRILTPNEGSVRVEGKVSALLELGAGFHPELSGRENVYLNGAILGLSQNELKKRFDEIVDFAGVGAFIDEPVKNYSSGMYVRLGFSVAINVDPDVLFVDEVLAVGDEAFQRKCNDKFRELSEAGKTIVLVSHGLAGVEFMCDRVAWFSHGEVLQVGPARDVVMAYSASVQEGRHIDETGHLRWGSGEIRVTGVYWLDQDGGQTARLRSGAPARLRLLYETSQAVARPVFSVKITTDEGLEVTTATSRDVGCLPEKLEGHGHVDLTFDRLPLLKGIYHLTVSATDMSRIHEYDVRAGIVRFEIEKGDLREPSGVVALGGQWNIEEFPPA
ncbi:MAG TPA: ABC transporter ATP-binding protein [Acidimicrobiales bacterium]|nr:ABC transporter ATP-binding protein [Acidimicrobiales bacterium]